MFNSEAEFRLQRDIIFWQKILDCMMHLLKVLPHQSPPFIEEDSRFLKEIVSIISISRNASLVNP
jgi:hypothetical protein